MGLDRCTGAVPGLRRQGGADRRLLRDQPRGLRPGPGGERLLPDAPLPLRQTPLHRRGEHDHPQLLGAERAIPNYNVAKAALSTQQRPAEWCKS